MDGHLSLLNGFATEPTDWAEPTYDGATGGVAYAGVKSEDPRGNLVAALETLRDHGFLEREFADRVVACPSCGSDDLDTDFVCPACGSTNTTEVPIIEHIACGCVRPREDFGDDDSRSCPKCETTLGSLADGCERMGTMHRCEACGERSDALEHCFDCATCGRYSFEETRAVRLYRYRFHDDRRERLDRLLSVRDAITTALERRGYEVHRDAVLLGTGGKGYPVDLAASRRGFGTDLAIGIREAVDVAAIDDLERIGTETNTRPLLVAPPSENRETAARLAAERGVLVLRVDGDREPMVDADGTALDGILPPVENVTVPIEPAEAKLR